MEGEKDAEENLNNCEWRRKSRGTFKSILLEKNQKIENSSQNQKCGSLRGVLDTIKETHAVNKLKGLIK